MQIGNATTGSPGKRPAKVISREDIAAFHDLVHQIPVAENVVAYAVDLVRSTRPGQDGRPEFIREWVEWGAGPRASQYLILGAKVRAALAERPTPDIADVTAMVKPVMRHRLIPNFNAEADGINTDAILDRLMERKP